MIITLICNLSLALFFSCITNYTLSKFPNEKVQNLNLIWYYVMEKILLILVPGYTYLYIILFENTYIFIICHKNGIIACIKNWYFLVVYFCG